MKKEEVINPIIETMIKIISDDRSTLLVGSIGSGKSTVINNLDNLTGTYIVCDGTLRENGFPGNTEVFNYYYSFKILKEIIDTIKKDYSDKYSSFRIFENYINNILSTVKLNIECGKVDKMHFTDQELNNFLDNFFTMLKSVIGDKKIILKVDDFDKQTIGRRNYQLLIHRYFTKYVQVVISISEEALYEGDLEKLGNFYKIVNINYNRDLDTVKEILNKMSFNGIRFIDIHHFISDELLIRIIEFTKGNLFDIKRIVFELCKNGIVSDLDVTNYLNNEVSMNEFFSGVKVPTRNLYISD